MPSRRTGKTKSIHGRHANSVRYWKILLPFIAFILFIILAAVGYKIIHPPYGWLEAFYITVTIVSTIGNEPPPDTDIGKLWTMFVICAGLALGTTALSLVVSALIEGQIRKVFGRRTLERKIMNLKDHAIVCGYGALGSLVATELRDGKKSVVVVDKNPARVAAAAEAGFLYVQGDAQEEETLSHAGVERAAVLIAALNSDAENVFITLTARQMNPRLQIIASAQSASSQDKLLKAGATRVVCPQVIGAMRIADVVVRPAVVDFVEVAHKGVDLEMDEFVLTSESQFIGRTLQELALPRRIGAHVVALRRASGETMYQPLPDMKLQAGDRAIVIGKRGVAAAVAQLHAQNKSS